MKKLGLLVVLMMSVFALAADDAPNAPPRRVVDKSFLFAEAGVAGATAFDLASTQAAIARGCVETNPFLGQRPSVGRSVAIIGAIEAGWMVTDWLLRRSTRSRWWALSPATRISLHTVAGINNTRCGR